MLQRPSPVHNKELEKRKLVVDRIDGPREAAIFSQKINRDDE